ncbi:MAG: DUF4097 family beta strand repeat-containing protein [Terriglobia bacterium]|jgi:hypothetical protein
MSVYTYRRGSIFWALTLIGVGAIFLWQNFNPSVHPWQLIAKFWPILIIFWGLSKLIDYVQAQAHPETTPPPLFSGSEVVMLVLILVMGTIVSKVVLHPVRDWGWHFDDDEISNMFLNSFTYDRTLSQPVKGGSQLVLEEQRGPVQIRGADQSTIDVTAKESIRADNESAAKKMSDDLKLELVEEAGRYLLRSNRRSLPDDGGRVTLDLNLLVPKATSTQITSERGDIQVDGLHGDQTLFTEHGDVRATNIEGLVKIHKSGSSTEVRGVKGSVELDGHGDEIEVGDVSDTVTVHGEYNGAIQFRNVGQTLRFESQRTDMTAQKLSGRLDMEIGSLDINGIDGPFDITTRQKDITVNEFKHTLHINDSNGQITLQTSTPPTHDIQVESKNGAVELTLPPSSNFQIEASSRHGEVECDFSGPGLTVTREGGTPSISGSYGKGGPMIHISTDYGAIRILRTGSQPPAPPAPPVPPGKAQTTWNRQERPPRAAHRQHSVPRQRLRITDAA